VLLRLSAQLHDPSGHAAIDATFFDRESASKHYCRGTNYAEFREFVLMCAVHNIKHAVKQ